MRAPGRVNLIGEHIDYAGLAVLPLALQREVGVVLRPRPDAVVRIANLDPAFPPREFIVAREIEPFARGDWGNYAKAAAAGLVGRWGVLRGFDGVVASDLPAAAGLSSSSALVVAAALALLAANEVVAERQELMELLAGAERYVGTQGGGMDQAICLGARRGCAVRIAFRPLTLTPVPVPAAWRFVVAHSLVAAPKSGTTREAYNRRRRQCERALSEMIAHLKLDPAVTSYPELLASRPAAELVGRAAGALAPPLAARFRHVVTEATRVRDAEAAMATGDLTAFGRLMNESHRSLRDDFEVSHAVLEELVERAVAAGAAGARLTGAGFGGSIVALATAETVEDVRGALAPFYAGRELPSALGDHLFVAEPSDGASVTAL